MLPLLDAPAVAALLGISRAAAYREMKKMQHVVIGERTLRVTEDAVATYVRQRTRVVVPVRCASSRDVAPSAASSPARSENGRPTLRVVKLRTRAGHE